MMVHLSFSDPYGVRTGASYIEGIKAAVNTLMTYFLKESANEYTWGPVTWNEIDQQGHGLNATNCGVITFANIEDVILNRPGSTIQNYRSPGHAETILQRRAYDLGIVGDDPQKIMGEIDSNSRIVKLQKDQESYRQNKKAEYVINKDMMYFIENIDDSVIDLFYDYVESLGSLELAVELFKKDYDLDTSKENTAYVK